MKSRAGLVASLAIAGALAACGSSAPTKCPPHVQNDGAAGVTGGADAAPDALAEAAVDAAAHAEGGDAVVPELPPEPAPDASADVVLEGAPEHPDHPIAVLTPVPSDKDVTRDIVADEQAFYFVSPGVGHPQPGDIFKLPRAGGKTEVLVPSLIDPGGSLSLHGGTLIYMTAGTIRRHELATGADTLFEEPPAGGSITSVRAAADGVYWSADVSTLGSLNHRPWNSTATVRLDGIERHTLLAADKGQAFLVSFSLVIQGSKLRLWNVGTPTLIDFATVRVGDLSKQGIPMDEDAAYLASSPGLRRVSRHGESTTTLGQGTGMATVAPVLVGKQLVWRVGVDHQWFAVSTSDMSPRPVEGLTPCNVLFTGGGGVFCLSTFPPALYEITFTGL